jgi:hypothetical protein
VIQHTLNTTTPLGSCIFLGGIFFHKENPVAKKELKFLQKLKEPHVRKRDGETVNFFFSVTLSNDEAVALSELFALKKATEPHISLIKAFLINQAMDEIEETKLAEIMAKFKLKQMLSEALAKPQFDKAMSYIKNPPAVKEVVKPERRVYIPEPRRR